MYTLAIVYRLPWKMTMETIGKSSRFGSFSIAMLHHQGIIGIDCGQTTEKKKNTWDMTNEGWAALFLHLGNLDRDVTSQKMG